MDPGEEVKAAHQVPGEEGGADQCIPSEPVERLYGGVEGRN